MPDFSSYLESVRRHYEQWWSLYTLTDAEGRAQVKAKGSMFDFGLMVQTIAPKSERLEGERLEKESIERFTVLEGLRKYAADHVLLVGRPGSGKSTALARLLLEEAEKADRIPVLVELRYWGEGGVLGLIQGFLRSLPIQVGLTSVEVDRITLEALLRSNRFLLLIDGLNELPSEAARLDVQRFRREFPRVETVFTTRDLSLGGDFGIEKRLEMQPLSEAQMRSFVGAYLPEQGEAMLRQLGGRLREFGSTPLLLWMLCGLFRQTGEIPANLGGVFRAFTMGYEGALKADVVAECDRRWWAGLLQALAARMMIGDGSVEFRVAIDRAEVEAIFTEFLRGREALATGAARKGLEDLLRHHLIQANGSQVEFRHQLIQEYYAAEWLLGRVGGLDDATLQQEFLNYLKWTEPVALMLALVEDEGLAVRVVKLALEVDLMLGARLAGEVRSDFQERSVECVQRQHTVSQLSSWFLINLFDHSHSDAAVPSLLKALAYSNHVGGRAAVVLGNIGSESALLGLLKALEHSDRNVRKNAADALCLINSESAIPGLLKALKDSDHYVRRSAAGTLYHISSSETLCHISSEASLPGLLEALDDSDPSVRRSAAETLGNIGLEAALPGLLQALEDSEHGVRRSAASALGNIGLEAAIPYLLKALEDSNCDLRWVATEALGKIGSEKTIPGLLKALEDSDRHVRWIATFALGKIGSEETMPGLLKALEDSDRHVSRSATKALSQIDSEAVTPIVLNPTKDSESEANWITTKILDMISGEAAIPVLLETLEDSDRDMRWIATKALSEIGSESTIPGLLKALEDSDRDVRWIAAKALGTIVSESTIPGLLKALEDSDRDVRLSVAEALGKISSAVAIPGLLKALEHSDSSVRWITAGALSNFKYDRAAHILPNLLQLLLTKSEQAALKAIQGIQVNCKFYNYEIQQAKLRKADRPSLEGGKADRSVIQNFYGTVYGLAGNVEGDQIIAPPPDLLN